MKTLWNWVLYHEGGGNKPNLRYDPRSGLLFGVAKRKDYSMTFSPKTYWQKWSHFK